MSIIVAGGLGFIGINLIKELLKKKKSVFIIEKLKPNKLLLIFLN
tara:strand:- start:161 stop:295 length:135 start_codon:yes stop_codon:yes gene_type:complete